MDGGDFATRNKPKSPSARARLNQLLRRRAQCIVLTVTAVSVEPVNAGIHCDGIAFPGAWSDVPYLLSLCTGSEKVVQVLSRRNRRRASKWLCP